DDLLLRVTLPVAEDRRASFVSTRRTRRGTALRRLERCSAHLEVTHVAWAPGTKAEVQVDVRNTGDEWWPVESFYPRHTVELLGKVIDVDGRKYERDEVPFEHDVAPGETVTRTLVAPISGEPGHHQLELQVAQIEDGGRFTRCGESSLYVPFTITGDDTPASPPLPPR